MAGIPTTEPYAMPSAYDLPENIASWTVQPDRAVLLIHDMQRFFLRALPDSPREELLANAARLRGHFTTRGAPVAYTAQPGGMSAGQRGLLKEFWGPGMDSSPEHREIVPWLAPADGDWVFTKWRYSAFFASDLLARMRAQGRDQLVVCGVYAHIGVLMTAVEAFSNDIETFLVADAVADFSADRHRQALEYAARCCAVVTTVKEVVS
ncbi:isochorismatase family protein [Streptomyces sp. 184]|uniref:isochorismatase family protein n=1 Tax=Streptomyces sp. 184 TaxID=1827526 RepID=UPI0038914714